MTELCHVLSVYSYIPMLTVDIMQYDEFYDQEILKMTIRFTQYGYSIASEVGVITADSFNQMVHLIKREYCPDEILEPMIEWAVR